MAAKYFHSLTDENPDFQKQLGCMNGVFHIFNRNHIVSRNRIKRVPPGGLLFNNGTPERESPGVIISQRSPNLDLRDIVKDSMYREARGLSHNVLVELQEPNWYYCNETNQLSRSKSCQFKDGFSKIYPRFSYDGQTTTPKQLREVPRLSLDSKERSIRILTSVSVVPIKPFDSKSNLDSTTLNSNGEKGLNLIQTRPPSVVAKLMGLETFPDSSSTSTNDKDLDLLSKSLKETDDCGSIKIPKSKPISRVPIEAAPWKHRDSGQSQTPQKPSHSVTKSASVYSEVDKRLKNLEFLESGKDLRALKQILESMQAVEARKCERDNTVNHQKPPSDQESHIVIMKPGKFIEKGFINNKVGKDPITKPRKQSESRCHNRRQSSNPTKEKSTFVVKLDESVTPEYASPVSVLDDSVYIDNSPSPVKHTPNNTRKDYAKDQYEATNKLIATVTCQINREKLQKIEHLVRKLKKLNSSHDEAHTDYIASLCENTNPNDRYISEIFLASGFLLRDLESFEFHSSGHPINPELFLVLERTKFGNLQKEKFHRKLIFDAVNEILVRKLDSVCSMVKNPRRLLTDVCLEIEGMQLEKKGERCDEDEDELEMILREDVVRRSENWAGFYGGIPAVAMEVEWLIFRDLVNELGMSEAATANSCY